MGRSVFTRIAAVGLMVALACSAALVGNVKVSGSDATSCGNYSGSNEGAQDYNKWTSPMKSFIHQTGDGKVMIVQGLTNDSDTALVEYYDSQFNFLSVKRVAKELPIFGGFYATSDYYFLVTGQLNSNNDDSVECYRITKYDKSWNRLASAGLTNCNTAVPFDAGSLRMADDGGYLLIRTCHEMYNGHQANVTIQVNIKNMTITQSVTELAGNGYGYVSHSFNQFIKIDNHRIVAVDHGDAYPRSIVLIKYRKDLTTGNFISNWDCTPVHLLSFPGDIGKNETGATVGGFEISSNSYLTVGSSVVQDANFSSRKTRNIFISTVDKVSLASNIRWITDYEEGEATCTTPQLAKISDDRFVVLWTRNGMVYYTLVDEYGNSISDIYHMKGKLSDCEPKLIGNSIVWYSRNNENVQFYSIDATNITNVKITASKNRHIYEYQSLSDGVATVKCSFCGNMEKKNNIPSSLGIWWNENNGQGSYSSGIGQNQPLGKVIYLWIKHESGMNTDMNVVSSNPDVADVSMNDAGHGTVLLKATGRATVTVSHRWNPGIKRTQTFVVAADGGIAVSPDVEINGFQINMNYGGTRMVYSVAPTINGQNVVERGMVFGLADEVDANDVYVGVGKNYVFSSAATSKGLSETKFGCVTSDNYIMTLLQDIGETSVEGLKAQYIVRAYAKLADGNYVYSDASTFSAYDVADKAYKLKGNDTDKKYNYLYEKILSVVNPDYVR